MIHVCNTYATDESEPPKDIRIAGRSDAVKSAPRANRSSSYFTLLLTRTRYSLYYTRGSSSKVDPGPPLGTPFVTASARHDTRLTTAVVYRPFFRCAQPPSRGQITHHRARGTARGRVSRKSASQHCGATSCTGTIDHPSVLLRFTQPRQCMQTLDGGGQHSLEPRHRLEHALDKGESNVTRREGAHV